MPVPTESGLEERAGERRTLPHGLALESDALAIYRKAEQIDAAYALLLFRIARLLDRQGERQAALEYYLRARDQDICPLRSTTRHEEILNKVAERTKTPLLDAANAIAEQSMDRIPGNDWYLDHVHPAIGGHQLIAQRLVARIRDLRIIPPLGQWTDVERQSAYTAQMEKLGPHYLAEGQRRVQWLEYWARRERLFEETVPRNAAAFLRAGFRHLELGDEETARNEIKEALKRDKNLEQEVGRCAHRLAAEGRVAAAQRSREWTSH